MTSLCRATGVNPSTIRTWERRYGVPRPVRAENGRRRYPEEEVRRVQLLAELLASGDNIGDIIQLSEPDLELRLEQRRKAIGSDASPTNAAFQRMLDSIENRDPLSLRRELGKAVSQLPALEVIEHLLAPLMRHVGDMWSENRLPVALEHIVSALVKNSIQGAAAVQGWREDGPLFVFGTPQGERHEIGALFAWYLAISENARCVYLGPDLPASELLAAVQMLDASTLVLSCVRPNNQELVAHQIETIVNALGDDIELWIGHPKGRPPMVEAQESIKLFSEYHPFQRAVRMRANA